MNKIVQIEDIVPIIEEQLKSGGKVSFTPRGTSMLPLFRDNVDTVILATPEFTLKKYKISLLSGVYMEYDTKLKQYKLFYNQYLHMHSLLHHHLYQ